MRALKEMNMPKFVHEDVSLFQGLLEDLFPGLEIPSSAHKAFEEKIQHNLRSQRLQVVPKQVNKVMQLYDTMETRHATMVVGPTGSGKTTVIETLKAALTVPRVSTVSIDVMNPKA